MKKSVIVTAVIFFTTISCEERKSQLVQSSELYEQSMKIHDQIMPKMEQMFKLKKALNVKLDSLESDRVNNKELIEQIRHSITNLEQADKAMMDWMHNIKDANQEDQQPQHSHHHASTSNEASHSRDANLLIQQQQKAAIEKCRDDMEASILSANEVLKKAN